MNQAVSLLELQRVLNNGLNAESANPVPQALVDKFQALVQQGQLSPPDGQSETGKAISKLVEAENKALSQVGDDMLYMMNNMNSMTPQEFAVATMQMQLEAASTQVDLQVGMSFVTAFKGAVESLMRNQ